METIETEPLALQKESEFTWSGIVLILLSVLISCQLDKLD